MPTAGRLAGGIAFAVFGWFLATAIIPYFDEGRAHGFWVPMSTAVGFLCGWIIVGKRTGLGYRSGVGNGITGAVAVVFWMLFLLSFYDMLQKSFRKSYDGPMEGLVDVVTLLTEYVVQLAQVDLGIIVVGGGIAAGLFAEFFGKRFS
jgi:hypothetical protein